MSNVNKGKTWTSTRCVRVYAASEPSTFPVVKVNFESATGSTEFDSTSTQPLAYAYCTKAVFFHPLSGGEVTVELGALGPLIELKSSDFAGYADMAANLEARLQAGIEESVDGIVDHMWDVWLTEFAPSVTRYASGL